MKPFSFGGILIVEPNINLLLPYQVFSDLMPNVAITRVRTIDQAVLELHTQTPSLVTISTGYSPILTLKLLEELKSVFTNQVIPIIFIIDWSQRLHRILGTSWGKRVGVLHTLSSEQEVSATLERIEHTTLLP